MRVIPLIAFLLVVAACSDSELLGELGERSHGYVVGSTTTAVVSDTEPPPPTPGVVPVESVRWFNERIEGEELSEPTIVISRVWARGGSESRFVQASPAEIDIAVPGLEFPALLPEGAVWITSQLVYDPASATLDPSSLAAFGVWSVPPYTDDAGRLAVLRIGEARPNNPPGVVSAQTQNGLNLLWSQGAYRYDLLCYPGVPQDVCWQMSEVMAPLASIAPAPEPVVETET